MANKSLAETAGSRYRERGEGHHVTVAGRGPRRPVMFLFVAVPQARGRTGLAGHVVQRQVWGCPAEEVHSGQRPLCPRVAQPSTRRPRQAPADTLPASRPAPHTLLLFAAPFVSAQEPCRQGGPEQVDIQLGRQHRHSTSKNNIQRDVKTPRVCVVCVCACACVCAYGGGNIHARAHVRVGAKDIEKTLPA